MLGVKVKRVYIEIEFRSVFMISMIIDATEKH